MVCKCRYVGLRTRSSVPYMAVGGLSGVGSYLPSDAPESCSGHRVLVLFSWPDRFHLRVVTPHLHPLRQLWTL